jgi:broad specificity phosphatase PhoE
MARIYLVRHGRAAAGFGDALDPGLDALGQEQARVTAKRLNEFGPLPIISSPLKRARETAAPLAQLWKREPVIEEAVAEIPSQAQTLAERAQWLRDFMAGSWRDASMELAAWRENAIAALAALSQDSVIFSHFIAINAAVGAAVGEDRVVVFSPDNCSVTVLENAGGRLSLIEQGHEAVTRVN